MGAVYLRHRSGRLIPVPFPVDGVTDKAGASYAPWATVSPTSFSALSSTLQLGEELTFGDFDKSINLKQHPFGASADDATAKDSGIAGSTVFSAASPQPAWSPFNALCSPVTACESDEPTSHDSLHSSCASPTDGLTTQILLSPSRAAQRAAFGLLSMIAGDRNISAASRLLPAGPKDNDAGGSFALTGPALDSCTQAPADNTPSSSLSSTTVASTAATDTSAAKPIEAAISVPSSRSTPSVSNSKSGNPTPPQPLFQEHSGVLPRSPLQKPRHSSNAAGGTGSATTAAAAPTADVAADEDELPYEALVTVAPHRLPLQLQLCLRYVYGASASADDVVAEAPPPYLPLMRVLGMSLAECVAWRDRVEAAWYRKLRTMPQMQRKSSGAGQRRVSAGAAEAGSKVATSAAGGDFSGNGGGGRKALIGNQPLPRRAASSSPSSSGSESGGEAASAAAASAGAATSSSAGTLTASPRHPRGGDSGRSSNDGSTGLSSSSSTAGDSSGRASSSGDSGAAASASAQKPPYDTAGGGDAAAAAAAAARVMAGATAGAVAGVVAALGTAAGAVQPGPRKQPGAGTVQRRKTSTPPAAAGAASGTMPFSGGASGAVPMLMLPRPPVYSAPELPSLAAPAMVGSLVAPLSPAFGLPDGGIFISVLPAPVVQDVLQPWGYGGMGQQVLGPGYGMGQWWY